MPKVILYHPAGMPDDQVDELVEGAQFVVARDLSAPGMRLDPGMVEVVPVPYRPNRTVKSVIWLDVHGLPVPDRMDNIDARMEDIVGYMAELVEPDIVPEGKKPAQALFIAVPEPQWA